MTPAVIKYVEELVAVTVTGTAEQRLSARLGLVRALRQGSKFFTRSMDLSPCSTHALETWGAQ